MYRCCPACHQLLLDGTRHQHLHTISHLSNSELARCDVCGLYLLHEQGRWEALSTSDQPGSLAAAQQAFFLQQ